MFQRLYIAILAVVLSSCSSLDNRYIATKRVDNSSISYPFSFMMRDSLSKYDLTLFVRHTNDLCYSDLDFKVDIITPHNVEWCDTVSLPIYDKRAEPLGNRNVMLYNVDRVLIKDIRFMEYGYYSITITPLLQDIDGLVDIGVKIEEID